MDVGLRGVFLCCKRAVQQMLGQEPVAEARGRIINLSSQHGMVGAPGAVAYCTAKGGVVNLTRQVAVDYGPRGIIVNAIAPGKILTRPADEPDSPEVLAYSHSRTPFARLGRPDDVAAAAVFLASDECSYVSGTNLLGRRRLDGILTAWRAAGSRFREPGTGRRRFGCRPSSRAASSDLAPSAICARSTPTRGRASASR